MRKIQEWLKDVVYWLVGSACYATSVNFFTAPNRIAPAGVTGIATVLNALFSTPIGAVILLLNLPLFWLGWKKLGRGFVIRTVITTVLYSGMIDLFALFLPQYHSNRLLACLYGGVLSGVGLALAFLRGGSTGGTDILARYLFKVRPGWSLGQLILLLDFITILFSAWAYRDIDSGLYAVVTAFVSTTLVDRLLYGTDSGKVFCIVSARYEEISRRLMEELERGVTQLDSHGAYSGRQGRVLLCVVRKNEIAAVRRIVRESDPGAFLFLCNAAEIRGLGFSSLQDG